MTNGIIQRAFNPYLELRTLFPEQRRILEKIQQELIEKIKQEVDRKYHIGYIEEIKLIGYNQE